MLITEWDTQTAIEVRAEEAYRKAKAEDRAEIERVTNEKDRMANEINRILAEFAAYKAKHESND
jgi:hypothetical protein